MKKLILVIIVLLAANYSHAQFKKYFTPETLRLDYYHSGNVEDEYYMPDELIREPFWGGSRKNLLDKFDYGNYKFIVYDSAENKPIYSRGYSTLFYEYRSTEAAKSECGNFPESVIMPFPKKTIKVEFYSRDKEMVWHKKYEVYVNPDKDDIQVRKNTAYPVKYILHSGNPKKKLDLVLLPEGYTEAEMGKFEQDCRKFEGWLMGTDPYGKNEKKINLVAVMAPSEESGTDIPTDSIQKNTLLNSSFSTFGSERYLMTPDYKAVRDVAGNAPYDQIVILVNAKKYGGGGIYNFYAISTVDHEASNLVFTHEFGHSFAGLGDEYYNSEVAVEDFYPLDKEPWEPNLTTLVDFKDKWQDMLAPGTPIPTPDNDQYKGKVGVFEGGGYMAKGVYRPYEDCSMNVIKYNNFCPVCKRAIQRMIDFYSK